ncbi:S9 family peptidase [Spongiactinospora gelatinilytica]|uniref:S9 family peptidase n=1 Tax=Spongiactinospora gelatinilytica TaxID=2666298 RepID=A0A2W2GFG9_9ACTN|nr:prolyl oligopeptidase family serine peptidase [Spongiactinospora gelatinilytica]PZG33057.1 S9 family peptidase [Spongiactinospora gelatinilytica]
MSPERPPTRTTTVPYTAWPSPISTSDVARAGLSLGFPSVLGDEVWWSEDRPAEGGRTTIMHRAADGARRELLSAPWSARSRVHEYGGRSYAVAPGGLLVFANHSDQRLYLMTADAAPVALTPDPERHAGLRYADLHIRDGRVWAVRERHHDDGKVDRAIVSIPLDDPGIGHAGAEPIEHVTGSDFYAFPTISPDGAHLAYICWNHPRMPWQGTELRVTRLSDGHSWTVKGGQSESVLAPQWRDDRHLYLVSDWSGWWNLYQIGIYGTSSQALHPAEEEFAGALWRLGYAPYAVLGDGRLAVLHGRGDLRPAILDPDTGTLTDLDVPYDGWAPSLAADGMTLTGIAYGAAVPGSVVRIDTVTGRVEGLRRDVEELPDIAYLPEARAVEFESRFGRRVHAIVYPPSNPVAQGEGLPPYVVVVHGGPTAHAVRALDLERAFFTSRGIGIIDVNYGGSSGYGRAYRERLRGQWGVIDVEDTIAAAEWLVAEGLADETRIAVRGGSAGGWTALAACCASRAFAGGVSYYGVSALAPLNATTHDFESRYVEWLVGAEDPVLYASREPLARAGDVRCPMLLLQGLDDPVVPPAQSEAFAAALAEHGVPCTYLTFEGESHGFRRAETRSAALAAELAFYQQIFWAGR